MKVNPLYLAGEYITTAKHLSIVNPFSQQEIAQVSLADKDILNQAILAAESARDAYKKLSSAEISAALLKISLRISERQNEFEDTIIQESAKPRRYARGEVKRAIETFRMAAYEATRLPHELIQLDDAETGRGMLGRVQYFSAGIVAGISPFNFPLNLVAHKIAPAIATKSPILLKPSSKTPLTALLLAQFIHECGLPKGAISVLPCSREVGDLLVEDERIAVLSFTGSPDIGWDMKNRAGKKKVVLELGGNAAAIVHQDCDLDHAVNQCFTGAFAYSGQVCIHTQRIYVHEGIFGDFLERFLLKTKSLAAKNPADDNCEIAVMIDESNAMRVELWSKEAVLQGAELILGGKRQANFVEPTVFTKTGPGMKIHDEEVFGPVVCINPYSSIEQAIDEVNSSRFGLQAALFSNAQNIIEQCFASLEVGGLILNRATTFRTDQMPYGGIKDSGFGREGIRYAMRDYLETKLLAF